MANKRKAVGGKRTKQPKVTSKKEPDYKVDLHKWQGYRKKKQTDDLYINWDTKRKEYVLENKRTQDSGINFTYFSACGSYPKGEFGRVAPQVFWSQNELGLQLWREKMRSNDIGAKLSKKYDGLIPLDILFEKLEEALGFNFREAYKNYDWRYELGKTVKSNKFSTYKQKVKRNDGTSYYVDRKKAKLYTINLKVDGETQGNPPTETFTAKEREEYNAAKER